MLVRVVTKTHPQVRRKVGLALPAVYFPMLGFAVISLVGWGLASQVQSEITGGSFRDHFLAPERADLSVRLSMIVGNLLVAAFFTVLTSVRGKRHRETHVDLWRARAAWDMTYQFLGVLDVHGKMLDANRTALDSVGANMGDLRGKPFWDCPWWTHDVKLQDRLREAVVRASTGIDDHFEATHPNVEGDVRVVDFRIRPIFGADGIVEFLIPEGHDISELRQAEQEEERSRRMLQSVLDTTPTRVFWKDEKGRFLGSNLAFAHDAGLERPEDLIGKTDHDMVWKAQADRFRADDRAVMESGRNRIGIEEPQTRADGSTFWLRTSKVPLRDGEGKVIGVLGTYEDVTDSRRIQEELETHRHRLEQVNQELERRVQERTTDLVQMNRELETFAHSAAHDLRTPLRAIDGWSHAVLEDSAACLDDSAKERLGRVRLGAQRIGEILDDLMRLSQASRADLVIETVDLARVAREQRDMLVGAHPGRDIEWNIAERLPVRGDAGLLRLLLWNLLDNAVKFTAGRQPAKIQVGIDEKGLFVRDNGTGFDMAHSGKLFRAFQRLHLPEEFAGTGIGLALVRRVAERHGGWVNAEGAPNAGATFHFMV